MHIDFKKQLEKLALKKVDQIIHSLAEETQLEVGSAIRDFFSIFVDEETVFQQLYQAYRKQLPLDFQHRHINISYTYMDNSHTITFSDKQFTLDEAPYHWFLSSTIEILRDVLPLGSVVELDPTYFKPDSKSSSPTKLVITNRFIAPEGYHSYFPYVGVVFPVGEIKVGTQIHFTEPLIQSVIQRGYSDEMEEAFVLLMKNEFIVEKDLNSIEFSSEDMTGLKEELERKQKVGEL